MSLVSMDASLSANVDVSASGSVSADASLSLDGGLSIGISLGFPGGAPPDPFMAFRFTVLIDPSDGPVGGFTDVTGLGAETDVLTLREGGRNSAEVSLAGPTKYSSRLILKRGLADQGQLWQWYSQILQGAIVRKDVTVTLKSPDDRRSTSWTFCEACPVKWTGPELHSTTSAVAFESIELVHRGLLLAPAPPSLSLSLSSF